MTGLRIRMKRGRDGPNTIVCIRPDGSQTIQHDKTGGFFAVHDLTHYAVETTLGHRRGFYGLVAEGWDLSDFGAPWPRGRMPADTAPSELIVGFMDTERATGYEMSSADVSSAMDAYCAEHGLTRRAPAPTDEQLATIRAMVRELTIQWRSLPPGETLELVFEAATAHSRA